MKYLVGIGFVNRVDLLERAVRSIPTYWPHTTIVDNSYQHLLRGHALASIVAIDESPIPLSYSQTMNYLKRKAVEGNYDVLIYMHHDTEANAGTPEAFLEHLRSWQRSGQPWGVAFTSCYSMAAYNVQALNAVGAWDYLYLPSYFADTDYYRRLALAGYGWAATGLPVTHHDGGGNTYKADPLLAMLHPITTPLYLRYYMAKWGGAPGAEQYVTAFNQ